jgi:hypothetical protein
MQAGDWSLVLDPATPRSIRKVIDQWGHVFVYLTPPVPGQADATMIADAIWGGIVRTRPTSWEVGGPNMIVHLGDEDGKGAILETNIGGGGNTFAQYVTDMLLQCPAIHAGTATAVAGSKTTEYGMQSTARQMLDHLCTSFNAEYRVNKDWTLDTAPVGSSAIFKQTPSAIAMLRSSGRDANIVGISVTQLDVSIDAEEYITRAIVHDGTGAYTGVSGSATPYKDGFGNLLVMKKMFEEPNTTNADAAAHATNLVAAGQVLRTAVTLASDEYAITRDVNAGDWIWVYDEDGGLVDLANPIHYRGSIVFPMKIRVLAVTWAIERGMGVWYRSVDAVYTNLTDYVSWDPPGASFEVGAPVRSLTKLANTKT